MTSSMKKHWRTRYPIESFDPRWALLLKKALLMRSDNPLRMNFLNTTEAKSFMARLYQFRGKARESEHPDWKLFMRVRVSQRANELILFAQDSQFDTIFEQAGVGEDPDRPQLAEGEDITEDPDLMNLFHRPFGPEKEPQA